MKLKTYLNKMQLNKISYLFFLNLGIISLLLFVLNSLNLLNVSIIISSSWLFSIGIFSLTFSFVSKYNLNLEEKKHSPAIESLFQTAPYFFLAILIIITINQFFKLDFISLRSLHFTVLGIAFGFLSFYKNRDRIENEIENEKEKEEAEEQKRYSEFKFKFPRINKIPVLRRIVRWMYKEGWKYSIGLIVILSFQIIRGFYFIDYVNLWPDEALQFFIVNGINKTGWPNVLENMIYLRAPLMGYIQFLFSLLTNSDVFFIRFPALVCSIISTSLIYFITKIIINKKYALIATILYFLSSWNFIIETYGRPYSFYIFLSLLFFYFLIKLIISSQSKYIFYLLLIVLTAIFSSEMSMILILIFSIILLKLFIKKKDKIILLLLILSWFILLLTLLLPNIIPISFEKNEMVGFNGDSTVKSGFFQIILSNFSFNAFYLNLLANHYILYLLSSMTILILNISVFYFNGKKLNKFNLIYLITFYLLITLLLVSLTTFKSKEIIIGFLTPFFIILLISYIRNFPIRYIRMGLILFLITLSFYNHVELLNNYQIGNNLQYPAGISPTFAILPDFESPSKFVNDYLRINSEREYLIIVSYGISLVHASYLDKFPNYLLGGDPTFFFEKDSTYFESFTGLQSIQDSATIEEIINLNVQKGNGVIIVTSFTSEDSLINLRSGNTITHNPREIIQWLKKNKDHRVYTGRDNYSSVYLFENENAN